jgi:GrpB-like predicted nucleotidyltransferase (UPF0157 family)
MTDQPVAIVGYDPGWPDRFAQQRPVVEELQARTHHLHVIEDGHPHAVALLAFRDLLRADRRLRREYSELKDRLARQHSGNRNAYSNAKGSFVAQALRQAGIDPPHRDALPE